MTGATDVPDKCRVFCNLKCKLYSPKLGFLLYFPSIERTFITW